MRNEQLIRQWKILKGISTGVFNLSPMGIRSMAAVFHMSVRNTKRDLMGLRDAGFLAEYCPIVKEVLLAGHVVRLPVVRRSRQQRAKTNKTWRHFTTVPELQATVHAVSKLMTDEAREINPLKCNGCTYVFKLREGGQIDMHDFRAHKAICKVLSLE